MPSYTLSDSIESASIDGNDSPICISSDEESNNRQNAPICISSSKEVEQPPMKKRKHMVTKAQLNARRNERMVALRNPNSSFNLFPPHDYVQSWHTDKLETYEIARDTARRRGKAYEIPKLTKYETAMQALLDKPTHLDVSLQSELEDSKDKTPPLLLRAYSQVKPPGKGAKVTNGFSSIDLYQPAADIQLERDCHDSIFDMSAGGVVTMTGHHLLWRDLRADEFLSWSRSMLFCIEHALGRFRKNQGDCMIAMIVPSKAQTTNTRTSPAGKPVPFYVANELLEKYDLPAWDGWGTKDRIGLHPRKFTHEYLSHGVILYKSENERHVPLEEIIEKGLFEIYGEFDIPEGHKSTGLYTRLVALRRALFLNVKEPVLEMRDIEFAHNVARGFLQPETVESGTEGLVSAPLHLVLMLLGLRKRPQHSELLKTWIAANYCAEDLQGFIYPTMHHVADNLFEVIQYLDLVRDACDALDVPVIPATIEIHGLSMDEDKQYLAQDEQLLGKAKLYLTDQEHEDANKKTKNCHKMEKGLVEEVMQGAVSVDRRDSGTGITSDGDNDSPDSE